MMKRFWVNGEVFCPEIFYTRAFETVPCTWITHEFYGLFLRGARKRIHTSIEWILHQFLNRIIPSGIWECITSSRQSRHIDIFLDPGIWSRISSWGNGRVRWGNTVKFPFFSLWNLSLYCSGQWRLISFLPFFINRLGIVHKAHASNSCNVSTSKAHAVLFLVPG